MALLIFAVLPTATFEDVFFAPMWLAIAPLGAWALVAGFTILLIALMLIQKFPKG